MNIQQIPNVKEYRECFTSPKGFKIVNADFSNQENLITADKSGDDNMIKLIKEGKDMHSFVARHVFPELEDVSDEDIKGKHSKLRSRAKAAGFACAYGGTGFTISKNLGISEKLGDLAYEGYFNAFPKLKEYFTKITKETVDNGYILINDITKRRRSLPEFDRLAKIKGDNSKKKLYARLLGKISRLAANSPTQGTAADQTKLAGIIFRDWIYENNYKDDIFLNLTVHDELGLEVKDELAELAATKLQYFMEKAGNRFLTKVKLKADAVIGLFWTH